MIGAIKRQLRSVKRMVTGYFTENAQQKNAPYPTVDLYYWQPKDGVNFGDELSRVMVELMLAKKGYTLSDEVAAARQMTAIGSVLHFAKDNAVIWGSGKNGRLPDDQHHFKSLDVRAVRGPRTKDFLNSKGIKVPDIFGDPALLLPALTGNRFVPTAQYDVALIPNLNDYWAKYDFSNISIPIIDPRQSWNKVVSKLIQYKFIIASSLHGLILAEAFGIPARYVRLTEVEDTFKYHDYYEGTGRSLSAVPSSVQAALEMGGEKPLRFDTEKLLNSFPYDIWKD
jgi:pyruvyltransferase